MKKYTKEEFLALIDESVEQSKRGKGYSWEEVQGMTHEKYGLQRGLVFLSKKY